MNGEIFTLSVEDLGRLGSTYAMQIFREFLWAEAVVLLTAKRLVDACFENSAYVELQDPTLCTAQSKNEQPSTHQRGAPVSVQNATVDPKMTPKLPLQQTEDLGSFARDDAC